MSRKRVHGKAGEHDDDDEAIGRYQAVQPHTFTRLERLVLEQPAAEEDEVVLQVTLSSPSPPDAASRVLLLSFFGVEQLRFTPSRFMPFYLEIYSIHDRGWEGLEYLVHEEEEDTLSFFCRRFEVLAFDGQQG